MPELQPERFFGFPELKGEGVPVGRKGLNGWIDAGTFPPPVRLSANRIAWRASDLQRWKDTRPAAHEPAPVLWPPRAAAQKGRGGSSGHAPGRPRGSRVINGKLELAARAPE
jgi:predicted DNA-binding transcriptional regulator AlpA